MNSTRLKWTNVINRLHLPVNDQWKFVVSRRIISIGSDLSEMKIQILRYARIVSYHYFAVNLSFQVNNGSNFRIIIVEVNGEINCKVIPKS